MLASAVLCALCFAPAALAHEFDPALLDLRELGPGLYGASWTISIEAGEARPSFGSNCVANVPDPVEIGPGRLRASFRVTCDPGELGPVGVAGLKAATDAVVRLTPLDGPVRTGVVRAAEPTVDFGDSAEPDRNVRTYLWLGAEHILRGLDHLLFVLGLLLLTWGPVRGGLRRLVLTVTAFTLGHSVTLAVSTLGLVRLAAAPVEATIALSILLLAVEIPRNRDRPVTLTARYPWLIAAGFGLIHGLGFAAALQTVGLPSGELPLALFLFNVGVELGQLAFVACVLGLVTVGRRLWSAPPPWLPLVPAYGIGALAAAWTIERVASIF